MKAHSISFLAILSLVLSGPTTARGQTVLSSAGGSVSSATHQVQHTIGEAVVGSIANGSVVLTQGMEQPLQLRLRVDLRALLQGPYQPGTQLMSDALRANGWIPFTEPYTALGFTQVGGGGETVDPSILTITGPAAIVDWVLVQLRSSADPSVVMITRNALVRADGRVVDRDGTSPVSFGVAAASYFIAVFHRNHLGVMTQDAIALSTTAFLVDLTDGSTATNGTDAQAIEAGTHLLWAGDVVPDGLLKYTGMNNDRDPILFEIGGSVPTNSTTGYKSEDVNMDGVVKYTGVANDRDPILQNIGGIVPTAVRNEQIP